MLLRTDSRGDEERRTTTRSQILVVIVVAIVVGIFAYTLSTEDCNDERVGNSDTRKHATPSPRGAT